jgi:hypothetical protein
MKISNFYATLTPGNKPMVSRTSTSGIEFVGMSKTGAVGVEIYKRDGFDMFRVYLQKNAYAQGVNQMVIQDARMDAEYGHAASKFRQEPFDPSILSEPIALPSPLAEAFSTDRPELTSLMPKGHTFDSHQTKSVVHAFGVLMKHIREQKGEIFRLREQLETERGFVEDVRKRLQGIGVTLKEVPKPQNA